MKFRILISFMVLTAMLFSMPAAYAAPAPSTTITPRPRQIGSRRSTLGIYIRKSPDRKSWYRSPAVGILNGKLRVPLALLSDREADGGPLPDGAEIVGASLRLYKTNLSEGTVIACRLGIGFDEATVTWQNKPTYKMTGGALMDIASVDIDADPGWYSIPIPAELVERWANSSETNYGVAIIPEWSEASNTIYFQSDDNTESRPTLMINYTLPPSDTTPCDLTYTVSPEDPTEGELMTITATATDNKALSYVAIMRGRIGKEEAAG